MRGEERKKKGSKISRIFLSVSPDSLEDDDDGVINIFHCFHIFRVDPLGSLLCAGSSISIVPPLILALLFFLLSSFIE